MKKPITKIQRLTYKVTSEYNKHQGKPGEWEKGYRHALDLIGAWIYTIIGSTAYSYDPDEIEKLINLSV